MSDFIPNFSLNLNMNRAEDEFLYDLIAKIEDKADERMSNVRPINAVKPKLNPNSNDFMKTYLNEDDLQDLEEERNELSTKRTTKWGVKISNSREAHST